MYFAAMGAMQYILGYDMKEHPFGMGLGGIANTRVWVVLGGFYLKYTY
jgi:hypothetical protein